MAISKQSAGLGNVSRGTLHVAQSPFLFIYFTLAAAGDINVRLLADNAQTFGCDAPGPPPKNTYPMPLTSVLRAERLQSRGCAYC